MWRENNWPGPEIRYKLLIDKNRFMLLIIKADDDK
jgi:hypothetical protein